MNKKSNCAKWFWLAIAIIEFILIGILYFEPWGTFGYDATGTACYDEDDSPPKNTLKVTMKTKPQDFVRYKTFTLNDIDYTACIEDGDGKEVVFFTYVDTTGLNEIEFDARIRSQDASENKVVVDVILSTHTGTVIDQVSFKKTIYGTVRSKLLQAKLKFKRTTP